MNYVQFITSASPAWEKGGPTRQSDAYLKIMTKEHNCALVCGADKADQTRIYYKNSDIKILSAIFPLIKDKPLDFLGLKTLITLLQFKKTDTAFHVLESRGSLFFIAFLIAIFRGYRLILSPFGQGDAIFKKNAFAKSIYVWLVNRCDLIICQNDAEFELYSKYVKANLLKLPLVVEDDLFWHVSKKRSVTQVCTIGYLGRPVIEKGLKDIFKLANQINSECLSKKARLLLCVPELSPEIEELIASNQQLQVEIVLISKESNRFDLYAQMDVFCILPTLPEETSLAALEALLLGVKIINNKNCLFDGQKAEWPNVSIVENVTCDFFSKKFLDSDKDYVSLFDFYKHDLPLKYAKALSFKN